MGLPIGGVTMSEQIFTMRLRSVGNPDWDQYAPISEPKNVTGSSLAEMRKACEDYIEEWNLGGGNWVDPVVKQGSKVIGHFSYNLRFWEGRPGRWDLKKKEILIDAATAGGSL
jgi:hypothetical protein